MPVCFEKPVLKKDHIDLFGATSLVLFSALLGLNQVMIKLVNEGLQPVFQAGLRSLFALPLVIIFALLFKRRLSISDGSLLPGIFSGTLFAAEFIFLFTALDYTTVARSVIFFYTMPFWVALVAHFVFPNERLTPIRSLGLLLAFLGVILALSNNDAPATDKAFIGDILCLAGAVFWAGIALLARLSKLSKSSAEMQLIYQLTISAPIILFAAMYFGPLIRDLQPFHIGILAAQIVLIASFGYTFWFWMLSIYPTSDMASFGFLAPVFGVGFSWLVLGETIDITLLAALVLVGIGIVLINRRRHPNSNKL